MRTGRARPGLSAVFLDRDGVINRKAPEGDYVRSWADFAFLPRALEGLALLAELDVPIVVTTNQRGIARGLYTEDDLSEIHRRMRAAVVAAGGRIDAVYHCPHERDECACRKPAIGMFQRAADEFDLDLSAAAVLGDRASDMEAAARIGALRILVGDRQEPMPEIDFAARDLAGAAGRLVEAARC